MTLILDSDTDNKSKFRRLSMERKANKYFNGMYNAKKSVYLQYTTNTKNSYHVYLYIFYGK